MKYWVALTKDSFHITDDDATLIGYKEVSEKEFNRQLAKHKQDVEKKFRKACDLEAMAALAAKERRRQIFAKLGLSEDDIRVLLNG